MTLVSLVMRNMAKLVRVRRKPAPRILVLRAKADKIKENRLVKLIIVKN